MNEKEVRVLFDLANKEISQILEKAENNGTPPYRLLAALQTSLVMYSLNLMGPDMVIKETVNLLTMLRENYDLHKELHEEFIRKLAEQEMTH